METKSSRWRTLGLACAALFCAAELGRAGIGAGRELAVPNGDFGAGLARWTAWTSDGSQHFSASFGPAGGLATAQCALPAGVEASLTSLATLRELNALLPASGPRATDGEKLEAGAWVFLGPDCTAGELSVEVAASSGPSPILIAESAHLDAATAPHGCWLYLHTEPAGATDARLPAGSATLSVVVRIRAPGTVWIDGVQAGLFEYSEYALADSGFEDPSSVAATWITQGAVSCSDPAVETDAYSGARYLKLGGNGPALASQALAVGDGRGSPAPGQAVEACGWVHLEPDVTGLGATPDPARWLKLRVESWTPGAPPGTATTLAEVVWNPTSSDIGAWTFLATPRAAAARVPFGAQGLLVTLEKSLDGTVRADGLQAGERFSVHGVPRRHVACHYVGWYRSPLFPGTTTNPTSPSGLWRNWAWLASPACAPGSTAYVHDPDCASSAACIRLNLRRDGATSVEDSLDDLPLAGTYDSRDPDLLRYHVRLAQAIGIDSFVYDHQGHKLALQTAASGVEPLNEETFEALLDAVEAPGSTVKLAVMYEPKVHFNGWVVGEPTLAAKKQGIEDDLEHLLATYSPRKGMQKRDGALVVYVFRNGVCNAGSTQCLQDADWLEIAAAVEQHTGRALCLVADGPPAAASPFRGVSRWRLATLEILKYRTFADFQAGSASWPPPQPAALDALCASTLAAQCAWARADDAARFQAPIVWPGFDDSGVTGWAGGNFSGANGLPVCVRVADDFAGSFHARTWSAALRTAPEWVQIATWNDWNEGTQIEPRWNAVFAKCALHGVAPPAWILQQTFGRALEAQAAIALFKGLPPGSGPGPLDIEACAADYQRTRVVPYD